MTPRRMPCSSINPAPRLRRCTDRVPTCGSAPKPGDTGGLVDVCAIRRLSSRESVDLDARMVWARRTGMLVPSIPQAKQNRPKRSRSVDRDS